MQTFARILVFFLSVLLLYFSYSGYRADLALSRRGQTAEVMYASVTETIATKDGKAPKEGEKGKSWGFTAKVWILDPRAKYVPGLPNRLQRTLELPSVSMPEPVLKKLQAGEKVFVEYLPDDPRVARFPEYKKFSWSALLTALLLLLYSIFPRMFRPALWFSDSRARA